MSDQSQNPREIDTGQIDPNFLTVLLEDAGWRLTGGRRGLYNRLAAPDLGSGVATSVVVPLDPRAPDYADLLTATIKQLESGPRGDTWRRLIAPRLLGHTSDEYRFRRETTVQAGLIPWRSGEKLVSSARQLMVSCAKAYVETSRHFNNRLGQFGTRYLDHVMMGQTSPGSYIVTAYVPAHESIQIKPTGEGSIGLERIDVADTTKISTAALKALRASREALDHYHQHSSLSGFVDGIQRGISYELVTSLLGIVEGAEVADITIDVSGSETSSERSMEAFVFQGEDAHALSSAAVRLVQPETIHPAVVVRGRVHLLTKRAAGEPGVVGVEEFGGSHGKKVRVRLTSPADYHLAVRAHDEDLLVEVVGRLEKQGTLSWLYDASLNGIYNPPDEVSEASPRDSLFSSAEIILPELDIAEDGRHEPEGSS